MRCKLLNYKYKQTHEITLPGQNCPTKANTNIAKRSETKGGILRGLEKTCFFYRGCGYRAESARYFGKEKKSRINFSCGKQWNKV